MIPEGNLQSNVDRFTGFENEYDRYRPEAPPRVIDIITGYLGRKPAVVADIGCGTGLSTFIWKDFAERVIGVEPNDDMRRKALEKRASHSDAEHLSFVPGYSNRLPLESGTVDVVTCSQSFHWMEPVSTLREVARTLKDGGVFAAYDCDWPPTLHWSVEKAYNELVEKADRIISQLVKENDRAKKWNKEEHLKNLRDSGLFRFVKEIVFHNIEACDAERYVGLVISQGGVQTVFKLGSTALNADIEAFRANAEAFFQDRMLEVMFSYRMRLGVK